MKYKKIKFSTQLSTLYGNDNYQSHIELGRDYWYYFSKDNDITEGWHKIRITYIRSGCVFYFFPELPEIDERFFPINCFMASSLVYAEIDPMKDVPWSDEHLKYTKEYLEKRYCFDDEITNVINWDNSKEIELDEDEVDLFDRIMLKKV